MKFLIKCYLAAQFAQGTAVLARWPPPRPIIRKRPPSRLSRPGYKRYGGKKAAIQAIGQLPAVQHKYHKSS